ncbi:hypothetical protein [Streptomyces sp. CA2R106]|uniref:hypothetical protein n=1 Tax=Streptomyces sp. CA2R106 TaxID=3120153 RepID=UPI00300A23FB
MLDGVLIAESLRVGSVLDEVPLHLTRIRRIEVPGAAPAQPRHWTLLDFQAEEADAERLAAALSRCLAPTGGWYANFNTPTEAYVVFPDRVFHYPRGNPEARAAAVTHARTLGIPTPQLDWQD